MVKPDRRRKAQSALTGLLIAWAGLWAPAARATCVDWDPVSSAARYGARSPSPGDLIDLVNFGAPDADNVGGPSPLGLSPDGRFVATVLQRADLAANGYCQALVLIDLTGRQRPRVLDRGGDYVMMTVPFRGIDYPNGFPLPIMTRWSLDGRRIAFAKRLNGVTRIWLAAPDGTPARPLTPATRNVARWAWSGDGRALLYASASGRASAEAAIAREGMTGWHYDQRFDPGVAMRPQIPAPLGEEEVAIDVDTGATRSLTTAEHQWLVQGDDPPLTIERVTADGFSARVEPSGTSLLAPSVLTVRDRERRPILCPGTLCSGKFLGLWWEASGRALTVLRSEGWHNRYTALYRWIPGTTPRRLSRSDDSLEGCLPNGTTLICLREQAAQPPQLVAIDRRTGAERIVFDPNPGFAALRLGRVERLEWRNAIGREVYGDLVLPAGYRGGRLPVIVVQYWSRGFLRGGTGNEYPIQLFAARGFAVLSVDKPDMAAADKPGIKVWDDVTRANNRDWAERRNNLSAIDTGLDLLIARGIADPRRLALTGLSDGASSVRFATINADRFAAAALSSCCIDDASDELVGPAWEAYSQSVGYPPAWPVDSKFWRPYSFALNANRMHTPLLMQLADAEALMGLHAYTALKAAAAPVDLYVFPDEFHSKWQPAHRAAVWDRALDWFSFWLRGLEDPAPAKADQFARWRALRAGLGR